MNKISLLNQLQIDREERRPSRGGGRLGWIVLAAVIGIVAVAAVAWFLIAQPGKVRVQAAQARAGASSAAGGGGASLLDASGYIVARRQATVSAKITGKVLETHIEEGQHVDAGEVIARLDDSNARANLVQAQAQVRSADANLRVAQVQVVDAEPKYRRAKSLNASGYLSDQQVEDAYAALDTARANVELAKRQQAQYRAMVDVAQKGLDDTIVRAPFAGVITVKAAQPGEMVSPISAGGGYTRTGIGTIVDMDSLEVEVDVAESFINRVQAGMPATVKLNAYPDWVIPAQVIAVIPTADRSKATVTVRVGMKLKDPRIVPEMGARVSFLSPAPAAGSAAAAVPSVTVPGDAIRTEPGGQTVVFVIADGKAQRRAVRLGPLNGADQVLLAGVTAGETVAASNVAKLKDGASVRVVTANTGE